MCARVLCCCSKSPRQAAAIRIQCLMPLCRIKRERVYTSVRSNSRLCRSRKGMNSGTFSLGSEIDVNAKSQYLKLWVGSHISFLSRASVTHTINVSLRAQPTQSMHVHVQAIFHWCSPDFLFVSLGSPGGWGHQLPPGVDAQRSGPGRAFEVEGKLRFQQRTNS